MKRRKFIHNSSLALAGLVAFRNVSRAMDSSLKLVSVTGGQPMAMYSEGINALGGIQNFVKKNDRVVIKPGMAYDAIPQKHINSNPGMVGFIIEQCYGSGASEVLLFEHTIDPWTKCYKNSGIERIAKDAGARVIPANEDFYYTQVSNSEATVLKNARLHNSLLDADVFINLSVFNSQHKDKTEGAIKNLAGCIWERGRFYTSTKTENIAELLYYKKPIFNITEVYLESRKSQLLISEDIVAIDSYAAKLNNIPLTEMPHIQYAEKLGFGQSVISENEIIQLAQQG